MTIPITRTPDARDLPLPAYASEGAAGMDLRAAVEREIRLAPGDRVAVPTGLCIAIPIGYEGQIRPRSGIALRHGVTVLNAPGTIDADFTGVVCVLLINHGRGAFTIRRGDRIAQLVVAPVVRVTWEERDALEETERGAGGFGSTGGR